MSIRTTAEQVATCMAAIHAAGCGDDPDLVMDMIEGETDANPAVSLRLSARVFKGREPFSADLTADMARDAVTQPGLYRHWAAQQAERALRLAVRL